MTRSQPRWETPQHTNYTNPTKWEIDNRERERRGTEERGESPRSPFHLLISPPYYSPFVGFLWALATLSDTPDRSTNNCMSSPSVIEGHDGDTAATKNEAELDFNDQNESLPTQHSTSPQPGPTPPPQRSPHRPQWHCGFTTVCWGKYVSWLPRGCRIMGSSSSALRLALGS